MASGVNKVILIGRLGKDPEVRYTSAGGAVGNFTLATSESWTDKTGQKQEKTEWHRIVAWGKLAEICGQYLSKGKQTYVEGKLQTREWVDKEGQKKYTTEVVAMNIQFLGAAGDRSTNNTATDFASSSPSSGFEMPQEPVGGTTQDDEVPF